MSDDNQEAQLEEVTVLSSIYGADWVTVSEDFCTYSLCVTDGSEPPRLSLDLQVTYLDSYPSDGPPLYDLGADWLTEEVQCTISTELQALYDETPGEVVLFRWIEWLREFLTDQSSTLAALCTGSDAVAADPSNQSEASEQCAAGVVSDGDARASVSISPLAALSIGDSTTQRRSEASAPTATMGGGHKRVAHVLGKAAASRLQLEKCPTILHGETLTDRKSTFQPHCAAVQTLDQVKLVQADLMTNRKIASATHNIMAYRIFDEGRNAWLQDCDDDGETAAGSRVLHLMQILEVKDVIVVVTRWYGGIHLGADRFKHINSCARAVLVQFGAVVVKEPAKSGKSKKSSRNK